MTYSSDGFNYIMRLDRGERLSECLARFWDEVNLDGAWVSAVGGALEVTLGYFNIDTKQFKWKTFKGLHEITGMQGNLASGQDGKLIFHVHGTFSGPDFQAVGGHVKEAVAAATLELFVHKIYIPLHRKTDPAVGLQLLQV